MKRAIHDAKNVPAWKLVWFAAKDWEAEWISDVILQDLPAHVEVSPRSSCDPIEECIAPGVVFVVGFLGMESEMQEVEKVLVEMRRRGYLSIVLHVSDEYCSMPYEFYRHADLVLRNYW